MNEKITIVGAGIGGLTAALTLKQRGLDVSVFESSAEIKPIGAGVILANNAMQVFRKLGIKEKIEKVGHKISYINITDEQLNCISVSDLTVFEKKYGVHNIAIHRGELQRILANEIGYHNINLCKRLTKIEKDKLFKLTFEDNSTFEADVVIGADGIKSVVRNQLFAENLLRNAKQVCWRGICEIDLAQKYHHELNEAWGKAKRFGFVKISDRKVYWYALANLNKVKTNNINLTEYFGEFHNDILDIISATHKEQIFFSNIVDLKPIDKWQNENICLIGDAAHATTPNLGQGACQAIEDAYVLGKLLDKGIAIEKTFKEYESIRRKKAHMIVNTSWRLGKIAHLENSFGIWLRNFIMRNAPKMLNEKQLNAIFKLN